jgi:rhodanese-related sulfurtransferase
MVWMGQLLLFNTIKGLIRIKFSAISRITTAELAQRLAQRLEHSEASQPIILDARSQEEYTVSHLAGAQRVESALASLKQTLAGVSKDMPIVVYCSVGYRSAKVAQQLQQADFSQVFNLEGGLFQWANEKRPLVHDGQPTQSVHPYNALWGMLLQRGDRSSSI